MRSKTQRLDLVNLPEKNPYLLKCHFIFLFCDKHSETIGL